MKILFSQSYFLPYISGLTIYTKRIADGLVEREHKVSVLTSQHEKSLKLKETIEGVEINRIPYCFKLHKGFLMPEWIFSALKKVREADVIICNLPQAEGFWPILFGKILRKRTIAIYACEVALPKGLFNIFIEKLLYFSNFISCFLADKIISYTKDYAENTKLLKHFKDKQVYILPPIRLEEEDQKATETLKARINTSNEKVIGFAGRLSAEKGLEYFFEAIPMIEESIGQIKVAIAGPEKEVVGEEDYFKKISLLAKKFLGKIVFLGSLSPSKMASFYKLIDILVLPSINLTEAFGMVQVEAMLFGIPVVVSDLPGVRVPVKLTGMGKIAPVKNSYEIASAISEILKEPKKYIISKKRLEKIFSYETVILDYEKVLH